VTYADKCHGLVCHLADETDKHRHWLGWDFAHSGDCMPGHLALMQEKDLTNLQTMFGKNAKYWTVGEVIEETKKAAEQLAKVAA
jgi:hypothetical protein